MPRNIRKKGTRKRPETADVADRSARSEGSTRNEPVIVGNNLGTPMLRGGCSPNETRSLRSGLSRFRSDPPDQLFPAVSVSPLWSGCQTKPGYRGRQNRCQPNPRPNETTQPAGCTSVANRYAKSSRPTIDPAERIEPMRKPTPASVPDRRSMPSNQLPPWSTNPASPSPNRPRNRGSTRYRYSAFTR